jgi:hypothetical protein
MAAKPVYADTVSKVRKNFTHQPIIRRYNEKQACPIAYGDCHPKLWWLYKYPISDRPDQY